MPDKTQISTISIITECFKFWFCMFKQQTEAIYRPQEHNLIYTSRVLCIPFKIRENLTCFNSLKTKENNVVVTEINDGEQRFP